MLITKAVVLAAGRGNRLSPFTDRLPKPMMPVLNRPIIEHTIMRLVHHGIKKIYCNLHYRPEDLIAYFADTGRLGADIMWRIEPSLTGPAGGVLLFSEFFKEETDLLVVSGDALYDFDLEELIRFHQERSAVLSVVTKEMPDPGRYGVCRLNEEGRIIDFEEKPAHSGLTTGLVSCGIYCMSTKLLDLIPRGVVYDFGRDLIPMLALSGAPVYGFKSMGYWRDVGTTSELRMANLESIAGAVDLRIPGREGAAGLYVQEGVSIGRSFQSLGPVLLGEGTKIGDDVRLIGPCVIGPRVVIGNECEISSSVFLKGACLASGSLLADALLGSAVEAVA